MTFEFGVLEFPIVTCPNKLIQKMENKKNIDDFFMNIKLDNYSVLISSIFITSDFITKPSLVYVLSW